MKKSVQSFTPPENWISIKTIDMHTEGEPLRVILDGFPDLKGSSVLDYRNHIKTNYDHIRTALMFEPRGHSDMYGVVVTPSSVADFGVVFMHNEGYSTMCGHATIAIAKLAVESEWVTVKEPETHLTIEAPCGTLNAYVEVSTGTVRFQNVPSFVVALNQKIQVPGIGKIEYDLAYGGAYYAFVDADRLNISCSPENSRELIEKGVMIKQAVMNSQKIVHPSEEDLGFLYGTIFISKSVSKGADSRNVCIFADGELDRSPTGSGVSARLAIHYKRQELKVGETILIESIIGTSFNCKIVNSVTMKELKQLFQRLRPRPM